MSSRYEATEVIAIFLDERVSLTVLEVPPKRLRNNGIEYRPEGPPYNGFYDWLRSDRKIVGLRQNPLEPSPVLDDLPSYAYLEKGSFGAVAVFFSEVRSFDPANSSDQGFGFNQLWLGSDGRAALLVTLSDLNDEEVNQMEKYATQL